MIVMHQKISSLLQDTMDKMLGSRIKLVLFISVKSYYDIVQRHVMLKLKNLKCKIRIIILINTNN